MAHTTTASDRSAHIVYALYGPSHGRHLEVWNRTWLSGKKFVYVPDAPKGPFAANFRGVHAREKRGASNPASRYRFISDANMLWAAHIANMSFPTARWIMVVDADTFCFDRTLRARTRSLEWRRPIAIGMMGGFGKAYGGVVRRSDASCESVCTKENGDGNYELRLQSPAMRGCCMCPVLPAADSFALSPNGTAYYRPPHFDPYGGTGILLSRGLLDAIPSADWALCTRRLVCGSADFRLNTCISNLHNGTRYLHAHENFDFMSAALRDAISPVENIRYNVFWSTIHKDPVRRPMVLDHFRNGSCPWSMHKLQLNLAPQVYDLARHCLARAGLAPARTGLLLMVAKQPAVSAFPALTAGVATASDGSDDLEQKIAATVAAHPVVVYSKSRCGYSARTKSLFDSLGVEYHAVELDKAADGAAMQTALARLTKQRTVPNVFVRGSHLGGNDATQAAALSGELQKMLGLTS